MLGLLGAVLTLAAYAPTDAPDLGTPNHCTAGQVMRTRGIRVGDHEIMGLRSCLRGFQTMAIGIRSGYQWWSYGDAGVAIGRAEPGEEVSLRLRRHTLSRGTLADGTVAVVQTLDVDVRERCHDCEEPMAGRAATQTIVVCALPRAAIARCGQVTRPCPGGRCPAVKLVGGVIAGGLVVE